MRIKNSSVHPYIISKNGKTYVNVLISVLTDSGKLREIDLDIPTPVEEWEKADYHRDVVGKYRADKLHTNVPPDGCKK